MIRLARPMARHVGVGRSHFFQPEFHATGRSLDTMTF